MSRRTIGDWSRQKKLWYKIQIDFQIKRWCIAPKSSRSARFGEVLARLDPNESSKSEVSSRSKWEIRFGVGIVGSCTESSSKWTLCSMPNEKGMYISYGQSYLYLCLYILLCINRTGETERKGGQEQVGVNKWIKQSFSNHSNVGSTRAGWSLACSWSRHHTRISWWSNRGDQIRVGNIICVKIFRLFGAERKEFE